MIWLATDSLRRKPTSYYSEKYRFSGDSIKNNSSQMQFSCKLVENIGQACLAEAEIKSSGAYWSMLHRSLEILARFP